MRVEPPGAAEDIGVGELRGTFNFGELVRPRIAGGDIGGARVRIDQQAAG